MRRGLRRVRVLALVGLLAGCSSGHASSAASPAPAPTTPADQLLRRAVTAMGHASGFSFAADIVSAGQAIHVSGELAAPNRVHEVVTIPGHPPVELIFVGSHAYRKDPATKKWTSTASSTSASTDPRATFATLAQASSVHADKSSVAFVLQGSAARSLIGGAKKITGAAVLGVDASSVQSLSLTGDDAQHTSVRLSYQSIGSAPAVTAPPGV